MAGQQEEQDDVTEKAIEIGKAVGAIDAQEQQEEIPDYEIIEDDGDERLAKERTPSPDKLRKPTTTKEKREQRKKKLIQKVTEAKDNEIASIRAELNAVLNRQSQVDKQLTDADKHKVEQALVHTQAIFNQAKKDYTAAFTEGDGEKSANALVAMSEADKRYQQLHGLKLQYDRAPAQTNNAVDPRIMARKEAFESKHSDWYNPAGGDEDSEIAKAISAALVKKGLRPESDDFWDELENRLADRGVIDAEEDNEDGEDDYEEDNKPAAQPKKRTSPPVGGGSNRGDAGGKKAVKLPTYFLNTLKENGFYNNPEVRNKHINEFLKMQKASKQQSMRTDKGWGVFTAKHVIPFNDSREHIVSDFCWCEPDIDSGEFEDELVTVHHSADRREKYEYLMLVK